MMDGWRAGRFEVRLSLVRGLSCVRVWVGPHYSSRLVSCGASAWWRPSVDPRPSTQVAAVVASDRILFHWVFQPCTGFKTSN